MEVSAQLHAPAALPTGESDACEHFVRDWMRPRASLDAVKKEFL
jgi:hypothetical protein